MLKRIPTAFLLYGSWFVALAALLGSLYYSEIVGYPPCTLCWYQRICTYPLILIIPAGILARDRGLPRYVLPISLVGALIALYHNLLYWEILPETKVTCQLGISCTTRYVEWFGVVSIPLLSLLSYLAIIIAMLLLQQRNRTSHVE